jgi:hypothetical protein
MADELEDAYPPDDETFLLGRVVLEARRWGDSVALSFAGRSHLTIYNAVTLSGDRGQGFLALRGATVQAFAFTAEAIALTFSNGASLRVGLEPDDFTDNPGKSTDDEAMCYDGQRFSYVWCAPRPRRLRRRPLGDRWPLCRPLRVRSRMARRGPAVLQTRAERHR